MACLPQLGSMSATYAVIAGGCDWPLAPAFGLSNNDVELRPLRRVRWMETRLYFVNLRFHLWFYAMTLNVNFKNTGKN